MDKQREEFEAWYASQDQSDSEPERTYELSEDGMNDLTKDCLWQGWQAAQAAQPAQVPGWLPIESAPKDGSSYLVWAGGVGMAHYVENYASGYPHKAPFSENLASWKAKATHWMPLPAAPSPKEGQP